MSGGLMMGTMYFLWGPVNYSCTFLEWKQLFQDRFCHEYFNDNKSQRLHNQHKHVCNLSLT